MKTTIVLFLIGCACLFLASCATPEQTVAAVSAVGATATALIQAMAPLLSPEDLARLQNTAATIDGTVQATATAVGTLADAIAAIKSTAGTQFAQVADGLQKVSMSVASAPSREEVYLTGGGAATLATSASRLLSHFKHAAVKAA